MKKEIDYESVDYDIEEIIEEEDGYYKDIPIISVYNLKGNIDGKYGFVMRLSIDSTSVDGLYKYNNQKDYISLKGTLKGNKIELFEAYYEGKEGGQEACSKFSGTFDFGKEQISGTWTSSDGKKSFSFEISNYYGVVNPIHKFKSNLSTEVYESGYKSYKITELEVLRKVDKSTYYLSNFESQPLESTYHLVLEDYNFDGYRDIALMEFIPSYPPNKYLFWLYNPDSKVFEQTNILDGVYSIPDINLEDSTAYVDGQWRGNLTQSIHKFQDGRYYVIEMSSEPMDGDNTQSSVLKFKIENGESVQIEE